MKRLLVYLSILFTFTLTGCDSYKDLDKLLYVTSILIDISPEELPIMYFETFRPVRTAKRETSEGYRSVIKFEEKTISEAINSINASSGSKVTLSHNKIILFTKKAAQFGIGNFIDVFDRGQESNIRTLLGIYEGSPKGFVELNLQSERMLGLFISDLIKNSKEMSGKGVEINLKEFLNQKYIGDRVNSLPIIALMSYDSFQQPSIIGIALIKNYTLLDTLLDEKPFYFNILLKNPSSEIIKLPNPVEEDKFVTIRILDYKLKPQLNFDGEVLHLQYSINVKSIFREAQGSIRYNKENLNKIKSSAEEKISTECMKLINEFKHKEVDVFDIQEMFEREYPKYKGINVIKDADISINVNVSIEGSPDTFHFK